MACEKLYVLGKCDHEISRSRQVQEMFFFFKPETKITIILNFLLWQKFSKPVLTFSITPLISTSSIGFPTLVVNGWTNNL